jgi:serine/threonine protein kinase
MQFNTLLNNRYQLEKQLSHKAGRQTFLANDLETNTPVIAKILTFDQTFQWDEFKLFEREVQILKNLDHSSIPKYLDYLEFS